MLSDLAVDRIVSAEHSFQSSTLNQQRHSHFRSRRLSTAKNREKRCSLPHHRALMRQRQPQQDPSAVLGSALEAAIRRAAGFGGTLGSRYTMLARVIVVRPPRTQCTACSPPRLSTAAASSWHAPMPNCTNKLSARTLCYSNA